MKDIQLPRMPSIASHGHCHDRSNLKLNPARSLPYHRVTVISADCRAAAATAAAFAKLHGGALLAQRWPGMLFRGHASEPRKYPSTPRPVGHGAQRQHSHAACRPGAAAAAVPPQPWPAVSPGWLAAVAVTVTGKDGYGGGSVVAVGYFGLTPWARPG